MGLRDLKSVALEVNVLTKETRELSSTSHACGPTFPQASLVAGRGFAVACHGWKLCPEIALVYSAGKY
jgi:hypothetical protein